MHLKITTICLTATFQGNSKQSVPLHFFPPLVLRENLLEINDIGFFRAGCLIHPTVSNTWGNTKHWPKPVAGPHTFFIHHHTPDGRAMFSNYRLFVPKTFRSQERKVPMENFRSRELLFPGKESFGERKFRGTFVPRTFCSWELSFPYLRAQFYNSSLGL